MTAATACRTCGTEPREGARFCDGCGTPVTGHDTPAEFKQVTVLFADVVHSMYIASVVGAERLREIMADLVNITTAVVKRYGGTVDKFTGDGIMAVFGAPLALEDHAVRACLAALAIQDELARLAAQVRDHDGVELASHRLRRGDPVRRTRPQRGPPLLAGHARGGGCGGGDLCPPRRDSVGHRAGGLADGVDDGKRSPRPSRSAVCNTAERTQ